MTPRQAKIERELRVIREEMMDSFEGCFNCGSFQSPTCAHLISRSRSRDLAADRRNLIVLCMPCHYTFDHSGKHKEMAKWDEILAKIKALDFRYYHLIK